MLKNLLNSFKALTLVAVSMVSGGALQAQDYTLDVEITGEGSAELFYYDYVSSGYITEPLETKSYTFSSGFYNSLMVQNVEGELLSVEINGDASETALKEIKESGKTSFTIPEDTKAGSLKLVFEGGEEPSEPEVPEEYDMAINLTVEGGEAEVSYWYYKADPLDEKQEGVLAAGMNYLDNMWNSTSNHYHIYLAATAADGYAVKEVYVDEHPTDYSSDNIFIQP